METTKITKRNMYEALVALATNGTLTYETDDGLVEITAEELKTFAENEIALIDKRSESAKARAAKKRAEGDEVLEAVYEAVSADNFDTIADIAARADVSTAKAQSRLKTLLENERVVKDTVKFEGSKTPRVVYKRA